MYSSFFTFHLIMSKTKEQCMVSTENIHLNDPTLGRFIEGYDSQKDSNPANGCSLGLSIFLLAGAFLALFLYFTKVANKPHPGPDSWMILIMAAIFLLTGGLLLFVLLKGWLKPNRVYVYQNGFIWKIVNRKGEEQSATLVNFADVEAIAYSKTRRYTNGVYNGTSFDLKVLDQKGKMLFRKKGAYKNKGEDVDRGGWVYYSLEAIDRQWTKVGLERLQEQLEKHGELIFKNDKGHRILLSRKGITMDDKSVPWETMETKSHDGFLWIDDSRKKKNLFSASDIKLNLNTMPNARLFLAAFRFLIQQSASNT